MTTPFSPATIEADMQADWQARNVYRVDEATPSRRGKFYACSMLPYPSGKLHIGHVRNYTINDVMTRRLRMQGYKVLMPMGWDAFGMPAENAALKNGIPPSTWTFDNIAQMKKQMEAMGLAIDWSREVATCTPQYYRWNQWFFLKMLEQGIAYRKTQTVNWDPVDQTVLANEQVIDGRGWRSGAVIEKRDIPGYYLRITAYAGELLSDLDHLAWPERVKTMQRNWIGKSEGLRFAFLHNITAADGKAIDNGQLYVFTTRADTIMGASFVAIAAQHPLAQAAAQRNPAVADFVATCQQGSVIEVELATLEKRGIDTGLTVTHPLSGETLPLWIGNYVLMSYGDGAVMGVPAHDERDFAFAQKYGLPIKQVTQTPGITFTTAQWQEGYAAKNCQCINSGPYNGLDHSAAIAAVTADLQARRLGEAKTTYRLRDWGISRQRYWGTPIPLIHCPHCGIVPVPEADLPVVLPLDCVPDGSGNPLNQRADFVNTTCPRCQQPAKRETDTMDTFVDSSWYFLRYANPDAPTMIDERCDYWLPMDQYIGGIEHAILHLLYARFWIKVMRDFKLVRFSEPFTQLLTQGMVLNDTFYQVDASGKKHWLAPSEVSLLHDDKGRVVGAKSLADGSAVEVGGIEKMSKSKNNGIDPNTMIERFGADTLRVFTMFAAPPEHTLEWSESGVEGAHRFLRRVWNFTTSHADLVQRHSDVALTSLHSAAARASANNLALAALRREVHLLLQQANHDFDRLQYNTVVSAQMKLLNTLEAYRFNDADSEVLVEALSILLRLLYPIAPHLAAYLWRQLGWHDKAGDILDATPPEVDTAALRQDNITLVVQVNGKLRGEVSVAANSDDNHIREAALALEAVQKHLGGPPKKVIIVKGRLVNIVA